MKDDRLDQALAFANYRLTINNQLHKLKIKSRGDLTFSKNGGSFLVDRELICFLTMLETDTVVLIDDNGLPVKIDDVAAMRLEVLQRYTAVTNDYYDEYQAVRKSRNVKSVLDFKEE